VGAQDSFHSIKIDEQRCIGCVTCMHACPVKAIRIRNGKASVFKHDLCIDCGECLRVCPVQAVQSMTSKVVELTQFKIKVALPSPVLYAQYSDATTPNDILLALHKLGFDHVYDMALSCEMVLIAMEEYLNRMTDVRPIISNYCPAVVRLILKNYPNLMDRVIPIEVPREVAAKQIRKSLAAEMNVDPTEIGIFHLTPCPAKLISIQKPIGVERSNLDDAIAIRDIYIPLLNALKEVGDEDLILQKSSGVGISWATSRSNVGGLPQHRSLTVRGLEEVIHILDQVEAGKLTDIDYLECAACPGGCVGGPLVVQNRHVATAHVDTLIEQYGVRTRLDRRKILRSYEENYLIPGLHRKTRAVSNEQVDLVKALEIMNQVEETIGRLPGMNCGACGAPDCRTLAEDIAAGDAVLTDCVFMKIKELEDEVEGHRRKS